MQQPLFELGLMEQLKLLLPTTYQYFNNAFVAINAQAFTLAHELTHILTNDGHDDSELNIMYQSTTHSNTILSTKRLFKSQQKKIYKSHLLK